MPPERSGLTRLRQTNGQASGGRISIRRCRRCSAAERSAQPGAGRQPLRRSGVPTDGNLGPEPMSVSAIQATSTDPADLAAAANRTPVQTLNQDQFLQLLI